MTGLAWRRAISMARFWTSGTSSSGSSTPRSPRATMMPSKAAMISARLLDRLGLLDLGDDRQPHADLVHDRVDVVDVLGRADEGQRDHVGAQAQRPAQVVLVLLGQGRDAHGDAGQVDALVVATTVPPSTTSVQDVGVGDLDGPQRDLAVVDEQHVAGRARRRAGPS